MYFDLLNAVSHLERPDGIIAIPGPDSYYLAAYPTHEQALARMIRVTRVTRQQECFLLMGRDKEAFSPYVEAIPPAALELMKQHWPGSLEILLPAHASVSETLTAGSGQVKLMQPDSLRLTALLSLLPQGVLAVCYASRFGALPVGMAQGVYNTFGEDVDYVLPGDGQICQAATPTVVSVDCDGMVHFLRTGRIVLD